MLLKPSSTLLRLSFLVWTMFMPLLMNPSLQALQSRNTFTTWTSFYNVYLYGIFINLNKCTFSDLSLDFLGHHGSTVGISSFLCKVQTIADFPVPHTVCKPHDFLGLVNFYHRFIPKCATILQQLTGLLSSKSSQPAFPLSHTAHATFTSIKAALATATLLVHPAPDALYCLMVDASSVAVRVFFSKVMTSGIATIRNQVQYYWMGITCNLSIYSAFPSLSSRTDILC